MSSAGISVEFVQLQSEPDATSPAGGWTSVLTWLDNNPPDSRVLRFFAGGLFGGECARKPLDGILVQLDSDILGNGSFDTHVSRRYAYTVVNPEAAEQRADEVRNVLRLAARLSEMTKADVSRHVLAPAVESTETWCVAAFSPIRSDFESLSGPDLVDEFMCALEKSEGRRPVPPYAAASKSPKRREHFCEAFASLSARVIDGCPCFRESHERLHTLAQSIAESGHD